MEDDILELPTTAPQISRDGLIFVCQLLASMGWPPGFLDVSQAFHSGDPIKRELYAEQPKEGIPGEDPRKLLVLLKTCYGLTDGPFAWFEHLRKVLVEKLGYVQSKGESCDFFLFDKDYNLIGTLGLATTIFYMGVAKNINRRWNG